MNHEPVRKVVIVGGGTAGWMAAAALSEFFRGMLEIELVESADIGIIGVGEATIPQIRLFTGLLGMDEAEVLRRTRGTYKLGIQFRDWGRIGDVYMHAFGTIGAKLGGLDFHHYWLRGRAEGVAEALAAYSLNETAALADRFAHLERVPDSNLGGLVYAYHFDAAEFAVYLREYSEARGVRRTEGRVVDVATRPEDGFITSVRLENGPLIEGDLFIDCTGFRGLLIEQTLHTGYEDWSHWLPCDRAVAVQTAAVRDAIPYTRSIAHDAGWQWRIPLQHRVGNGLVYCSRYISDDDARKLLLGNIEGEQLTKPLLIRFRPGQRLRHWNRNCVALGLASGFIEPLESTSIHLIQRGIIRLMQLFPTQGIRQSDIDEFNRQTRREIEHIRDFIVLHYTVTNRQDSPFWRHCRSMPIPDTLAHRIDLFRDTARVFKEADELFAENSWIQVMLGQGIIPEQYHPVTNVMGDEELTRFMQGIKSQVQGTVAKLPDHHSYVKQYCAAAG